MFGRALRKGFSMKVNGVQLNRPDLHNIAAELGIGTRDVLMDEGVLTVYNTSPACQEIIDDNALATFVTMALNMSPDIISDITAVEEEPKKIEFDFDDEDD